MRDAAFSHAAAAESSAKRSRVLMNWASWARKASMMMGSKCEPASWRIMLLAMSWAKACL